MKTGHSRTWRLAIAASLCVFLGSGAGAQEADEVAAQTEAEMEAETEALAKASQNPVGSLISVPLQNNMNFGVGPDDRTLTVLNIQPVIPLSLSEDWNLITRTIIPVKSVPGPGSDRTAGVGDLTLTAFVSPKRPGNLIWGVGPTAVVPVASDELLGQHLWAAGPSVVALMMPGRFVVGALASNTWSFGENENGQRVNLLFVQYFVNYNMADGWYLTSAPIITADWLAESGEQWTVPFGGGVGKIMRFGSQPVNLQTQFFYNAVRSDNGASWQWRFQFQLMFPK
jgi:hypothetical protein